MVLYQLVQRVELDDPEEVLSCSVSQDLEMLDTSSKPAETEKQLIDTLFHRSLVYTAIYNGTISCAHAKTGTLYYARPVLLLAKSSLKKGNVMGALENESTKVQNPRRNSYTPCIVSH